MKMKLQTSIAVLLIGLIVPTIAALGASSYYFSRDSASQLRARILGDTARDVYGEIGRLLEIGRSQAAFDRKQLQDGTIDPTDFKKQAFLAYELLGLRAETKPEILELAGVYADALERYRQRDWEQAIKLFSQVSRCRPEDRPSQLMIALCGAHQQKPPNEDWDRVHHVAEKMRINVDLLRRRRGPCS